MAVAGTDTDVTTSGSANDHGGRGQSNNAVATAATTAQSKPLATDSNNNGLDFKPNAKSSVTSKVVVDSESVKTKDTVKVLASSDYGNKDSAPENGKTAQLNGHVPPLSLTTPKRQRRKGKSVINGAQSEGGNSASEQSGSKSSDSSKWDQSVSVAPDAESDSVSESNSSSVPVVRVTLPEDRVPQQANSTDTVAGDTVANAESNGIDVKSDDGVGLFRPIKPILLLPFAPLPDDVSNLPVTSSATSSRGAASPVSTSGPVPPVPSAMAEAISRQQKGTGVRYWKTKQNGGDGGGGGGGGEGVSTSTSSMFPALRSSNEQPAAGSWGRNGNKVTKARERLRKQRVGYGYSLNDVSVREEALRRCGGNNGVNVQLSPHNATQHMFGHSLALPQPPPAYKRSVTGIGDYSHFLQLESSSHSSPLSNHLTDASSSSPSPSLTFPHQPNALPPSLTPATDSPKPILKVKLTHSPNSPRSSSHPLGQLPQGAALDPADVTGDSGRSNDSFMISGDSNNNAMTTVGALTCMQLADTILGTKIHDFARLYQLCETKIRYVDFLERAALRHGNALTSLTDAPLRCNTWVSTPVDSSSKTSSNGAKTTNSKRNGKGGKAGNSLILPALVSPSNGLVSPGNGLSNGFASPSNDFAFLGSRSEGDTPLSSPPPPIHIPPFPSGKPILKTLNNQDAAVVRINNLDLGSGSQRSGSLKPDPHPAPFSVRGATVYGAPVSSNDGGRKSQNSAVGQSAMSVRKRAVRFSIADQVKEYTPGEPVNQ